MKKLFGVILCLVLTGLCIAALADVTIDKEHFPDENFRNFIKDQIDTDKNSVLDDQEIFNVKSIVCNEMSIKSLKGIEYFTEIHTLYSCFNQIESIDLSHNAKLAYIQLIGNKITSLDVSNNPLEFLDLGNNLLTSLDVSNQESLFILSVPNNNLSTLDIRNTPNLNSLYCSDNQLTALDFSESPKLVNLSCLRNQITTLDFHLNPELEEISCSGNQLKALDVSTNTKLKEFAFTSNNLVEIDISHNPEIYFLEGRGNKLTKLDVSNNPKLELLWLGGNQISLLDVSSCPILCDVVKTCERMRVYGNDDEFSLERPGESRVYSVEINIEAKVKADNFISFPLMAIDVFFPDYNFSQYVRGSLDQNNNGWLSDHERYAIDKIACNNLEIASLAGIEVMTELEELNCNNNQIAMLDISQNSKIKRLNCAKNKLKKLDVSQCSDLCSIVKNQKRKTDRVNGYDYWGNPEDKDGIYLIADRNITVLAGDYKSEPLELAVGDIFAEGGLRYKITGKKTVAFIGLAKASGKSSVTLPATVIHAKREYKVTEIAAKAMYQDTKVKTFTIGANVKNIGKNAFASCTKLATVKGGAAVTAIGDSAFSGCKGLKTFPELANLKTIGANAMKGCKALTKFTIGVLVEKIGKNAFNGCENLKTWTVNSKKLKAKNIGAGAFKNISKKASFKCPSKKLAKSYETIFRKAGAPKTATFE